MKINNTTLTLENFRRVLKDYPVDVQDVFRSAILDNVDISGYLGIDDPLKLDQTRLALKEGLELHCSKMSGVAIRKVRMNLKNKTQDLKAINKVIFSGASERGIELAIDLDSKGYSIKGYRFELIPDDLIPLFQQYIEKGLDLRVLNTGVNYPIPVFKALVNFIIDGRDVQYVLDKNLKFSTIIALGSRTKFFKFNQLLRMVGTNTYAEYVVPFIDAIYAGLPLAKISEKDRKGYELFMPSQIEVLVEGVRNDGLDMTELVDYHLSVEEMMLKKQDIRRREGKYLKGRL